MNTARKNPFVTICFFLLFLQLPTVQSGVAGSDRRGIKASVSNALPKTVEERLLWAADSIYREMDLEAVGLATDAFVAAFKGYSKLLEQGLVNSTGILTIIDFSRPSTEKRCYVLDLIHEKLLFNSVVAHGRNSGLKYATAFSNKPESNKSSLGFYLTLDTYMGDNGYSLKLKGLEKGINDKAYERAIVMHGADYAEPSFANSNGYLGRSLGCPALPRKQAVPVINTIKNGTILFIYHPGNSYLNESQILNS